MAYIDDPQTQKANLSYIRSSMREPLLDKDHELNLARQWHEDKNEKALHELVKSYTRLVIAAASRFRHYGLPVGDLIQEGNIGLMQAANRFEYERGVRFSTYASWWIRSSMQDYILRNWSIVRTGTTAAQKSLFFNFRRLRSKIDKHHDKEYLNDNDRQKIAKELGVPIRDVESMEERLSSSDQSLNARVSDDADEEWQNFLSDDRPDPENITITIKDCQTRTQWLNLALSELSDREQKIIRDRHLSYESVTLEKLGQELGVSKERVRQLEQRAIQKLKTSIVKHIGDVEELFIKV